MRNDLIDGGFIGDNSLVYIYCLDIILDILCYSVEMVGNDLNIGILGRIFIFLRLEGIRP
jgi:hypothetical protein